MTFDSNQKAVPELISIVTAATANTIALRIIESQNLIVWCHCLRQLKLRNSIVCVCVFESDVIEFSKTMMTKFALAEMPNRGFVWNLSFRIERCVLRTYFATKSIVCKCGIAWQIQSTDIASFRCRFFCCCCCCPIHKWWTIDAPVRPDRIKLVYIEIQNSFSVQSIASVRNSSNHHGIIFYSIAYTTTAWGIAHILPFVPNTQNLTAHTVLLVKNQQNVNIFVYKWTKLNTCDLDWVDLSAFGCEQRHLQLLFRLVNFFWRRQIKLCDPVKSSLLSHLQRRKCSMYANKIGFLIGNQRTNQRMNWQI